MRRSVRDAGRRLFASLVGVAALALLAGCSLSGAQVLPAGGAANDLLVPQGVIPGGFEAAAQGGPGRAGPGGFVKLRYPAAIAANGADLFVADSGLGALLRIDTNTQAVAMLATLPNLPGVRLAASLDGSVYVLRPGHGAVERIRRDGQPIASFASPPEILQPSGLAIEPMLNRVWITDAAGGIFTFHPSGRMSEPLAGRGDGFASGYAGATVLAPGTRQVFGINAQCRCVIAFDRDGAVIGSVGEGQLINPVMLALDDFGRVWVMDQGDGRLKVFEGDRLAHNLTPGRLGLADITAIAIDAQRVYIADGPGGKVGVFALLPPTRRTP